MCTHVRMYVSYKYERTLYCIIRNIIIATHPSLSIHHKLLTFNWLLHYPLKQVWTTYDMCMCVFACVFVCVYVCMWCVCVLCACEYMCTWCMHVYILYLCVHMCMCNNNYMYVYVYTIHYTRYSVVARLL